MDGRTDLKAPKDTKVSRHETVDGDHGRIETRTYTAFHDVAWLHERHHWPVRGVQGRKDIAEVIVGGCAVAKRPKPA